MTLVDFYHLVSSPLERILPVICEKVLTGGDRLLVVAEPGLLGRLDEQLWNFSRDAFLPHGRQNGENQPILLSETPEAVNGATNIAIADGQWRDEALSFARAFYFFDAGDVDRARSLWRRLKDIPEVESRYWKQDDRGKWVQGP
ncbi:DNA polymerase III subunit chi [Sphingosinicella rhizophila]|uniref:DNA polymerase III subunit chi n=1 Tax=Sphingosinicella rhizophila TaxID=3050082 RepID=A0ABU3Q3U6_9SPHN|nr:DNA polymerase III subunit chi [Sphingosinicella sp. GR2756]MDT9597724.1 DNA polymerase III subunit chi [Sphingosinicella sp. GR2756]